MSKNFNQHILIKAENEEGKKKKKDSLASIFELMKATTDFQKEIEDCLDAQNDMEDREKIRNFDKHIDDMYDILLEIAKKGVQSVRKRDGLDTDNLEPAMELPETDKENAIPQPIEKSIEKSIPSPSAPSAPKAIR